MEVPSTSKSGALHLEVFRHEFLEQVHDLVAARSARLSVVVDQAADAGPDVALARLELDGGTGEVLHLEGDVAHVVHACHRLAAPLGGGGDHEHTVAPAHHQVAEVEHERHGAAQGDVVHLQGDAGLVDLALVGDGLVDEDVHAGDLLHVLHGGREGRVLEVDRHLEGVELGEGGLGGGLVAGRLGRHPDHGLGERSIGAREGETCRKRKGGNE
jgi:hypothetical protein